MNNRSDYIMTARSFTMFATKEDLISILMIFNRIMKYSISSVVVWMT